MRSFTKNLYIGEKHICFKKLLEEKMITFTCYISFGLSGLIIIIANILSGEMTSKEILIHTVQTVILGVITTVLTSLIGAAGIIFNPVFIDFEFIRTLYLDICLKMPQFIFWLVVIIGLINLSGGKLFLPGIKLLTDSYFGES
ncbi:MAG: hypothetical protein AB1782_11620 [Cyanobacteriota bacterium]